MKTQYSEIISFFVDQYGLSRGEVMAEIEKSFSAILSNWYGRETVVLFSEGQLLACCYQETNGVTEQSPVQLTTMRGWNSIKKILGDNLGKAACLKEVARLKHYEKGLCQGEIIKRDVDGRLLVELDVENENNNKKEPVIASCGSHHLGLHERGSFMVGQKKAFHLRRVEPVLLNGSPRVKVTVDRVSKTLVEKLLKAELAGHDVKIRCMNRYVGHKSFVEASGFLPKKVILAVSRELKEHIQVKVVKTKNKKKGYRA